MSPWRRTVYAAYVAQALSIMGFSCVMPFFPLYIRELGIERDADVVRWAGWIATVSAVTFAAVSPIWGALADRFGRKPMVLRSMFSGTAVLLLMSWVRNVYELAACRILQGALTGTVTASVAIVASVAPREHSGYAIGMIQGAVYLGSALGPLVGGIVADHMGRRTAFRAGAVLLLIAGLIVKYLVHEESRTQGRSARADSGSFSEVFSATGFLAAVFALFMVRFANSVPGPVFPLFVEKLHQDPKSINTMTGTLMAVGGFAAAIATIVLGRFSDVWGQRRLLLVGSYFTAAVAGLHALARNVTELFGLRILIGLGEACVIPSANGLIRKVIDEKNLGKAYGATTMCTSMGWALGPLAGGQIASVWGIRAPFVFMAAAQFAAAIIAGRCIKREPPRVPEGAPDLPLL